MLYLKR